MANRNKKTQKKFEESREDYKGKGSNGRGNNHKPQFPDKSKWNDLSWYVNDPQILADVARIPYPIPVGFPFSRQGVADAGLDPAQFDDAISGICMIRLVPTVGNAYDSHDAVNVAANGLYTFVRHLNSGSRNYDAVDMMLYVMAVDSVYYMISWMTRLYATLTLYLQGNRYTPEELIRSQRVDFNDLKSHIAEFRAGLNQRIRKIATLCIPGVMPIFARHSWIFSNYFIEGESVKDQMYCFAPDAWYTFEHDSSGAGMLQAHYLYGANKYCTTQELMDILDAMIDPIFADEDFNIMSGDILKAYGESNLLKLNLVTDELPIGLVYNPDVLLQFKNCKPLFANQKVTSGSGVFKYTFIDDMFNVQQDVNHSYIQVLRSQKAVSNVLDMDGTAVYYSNSLTPQESLRLQAMWNEWSKETLLTSPHANVEPGENIINTRLTLAFDIKPDSTSPDGVNVYNMYFGSEWPMEVYYITAHRARNTGITTYFTTESARSMTLNMSSVTSLLRCATSHLPIRSAYKYAPELAIIVDSSSGGSVQVSEAGRSNFEVDNYTLVSPNVIALLHNASIQGEYNIPRIAMFTSK